MPPRGEQTWEETEQLLMDLALYGLTMQDVQAFEAVLATVYFAGAVRELGAGEPLEPALEKLARDTAKAFQRATAGAIAKKLRGRIDEELLEEVTILVGWRNYVAHRYLRNHWPFSSENRQQLKRLAQRFKRATEQLEAAAGPMLRGSSRGGARRAGPRPEAIIEQALHGSMPAEPWIGERGGASS
jgi:acyl-homoserine lactone acylase PvdQ